MSNIIASAKGKYDGEEFTISIFSPELAFTDSNEYQCRFFIEGKGVNYKNRSIGFDSMQSLILSLKMIGSYIGDNNDFKSSLLEWEGGPMEFPAFKSI